MKRLVFVYIIIATAVLLVWEVKDWFSITGDEPHYLVMADGILHDGSLEQTQAYQREFNSRKIYNGLAPEGDIPSPKNTHAVEGPNGLFNMHNVGLPLIILAPYALGGELGVRLFLIVLASLVVTLAWRMSEILQINGTQRLIAVSVVTLSPTLMIASNQIYPDLLAGIIALYAICKVFDIQGIAKNSTTKVIFPQLIISILPWLQIKFSATAVILAIVVGWLGGNNRIARLSISLIPLLISIVGLSFYNHYAFGKISGPYTQDALVLNLQAFVVFVGLHIDRFQGVFIQNPIYYIGLAFLVPFVRVYRWRAVFVLIVYASYIVPNSLHPNIYGGFSFAGRFAWSAAIVGIPIVLFGISKIIKTQQSWKPIIVIILIFNITVITKFLLQRPNLYNEFLPQQWLEMYPSFHNILYQFLPVFYLSSRTFSYCINWPHIIIFVGLPLLGLHSVRKYITIPAFLIINVFYIVTIGLVNTSITKPLYWDASDLPSQLGEAIGTRRLVDESTESGFLSYGPYVNLRNGSYDFIVQFDPGYSATPPTVDVYLPEYEESILVTTMSVGEVSIEGHFKINTSIFKQFTPTEIRVWHNGDGTLVLRGVSISKSNSNM